MVHYIAVVGCFLLTTYVDLFDSGQCCPSSKHPPPSIINTFYCIKKTLIIKYVEIDFM